MRHGYAGDGGGLDPLFSGQAQAFKAKLEEQCRKAQATQAAVDARAAEIEARERAAARAAAHQPWSKYPGVLAGDIEGRKQAEEACSRSTVPDPPPAILEDFVGDDCNRDSQGAAIVKADRQTGSQEAESLLRIAPLPDGRGKR